MDKKTKKYEKLVSWLNENGAYSKKLQIEKGEGNEHKLMTIDDIKAGETLFYIPLKLIVSSEYARKSHPLIRKLWSLREELFYFSKESIAVAVYVLLTEEKEEYFFKPYYDSLPDNLKHFPRFWDEKYKLMVEGSSLFKPLDETIQLCYNTYIPELKKYSFEEVSRVHCLVESRGFEIPGTGSLIKALIPFGDMMNHSENAQAFWEIDAASKALVLKSSIYLPKRTEVYYNYGPKSNLERLLQFGFSIRNNVAFDKSCNDVKGLDLRLEPSDPLSQGRIKVLKMLYQKKLLHFHINDKYSFAVARLTKGTHAQVLEILLFLRVFVADEEELRILEKNSSFFPKNSKEEREAGRLSWMVVVSPMNELKVLKLLAYICKAYLDRYPKSLKENKEFLDYLEKSKANVLAYDRIPLYATIYVVGEQEILSFWIDLYDWLKDTCDVDSPGSFAKSLKKLSSSTTCISRKKYIKILEASFLFNRYINKP